jgi:hypothetical protein
MSRANRPAFFIRIQTDTGLRYQKSGWHQARKGT